MRIRAIDNEIGTNIEHAGAHVEPFKYDRFAIPSQEVIVARSFDELSICQASEHLQLISHTPGLAMREGFRTFLLRK